jgi:endonuclease-3
MSKIQLVADQLTDTYPWRRWDFGLGSDWKSDLKHPQWVWRHLIKTMLTARSREKCAFRAIVPLFERYPEPQALAEADMRAVIELLEKHHVKSPGRKAGYILKTSKMIHDEYRDQVPEERERLESFSGVGNHIASVIRATCYDQDELAVDIHVNRISKRLGLIDDLDASLAEVERILKENTSKEQWGHFSRSFVDFGQTICGYHPKCDKCPFASVCPAFGTKSGGLR